jgi:hypothetical protein
MKDFIVRFYCRNFISADRPKRISQLLQEAFLNFQQGTPYPQLPDGGVKYELREFHSFNNGASFKGVLAVLRDDAPSIREAGGGERAIRLGADEHLIEKNHFLYFTDRELLVWQVNGRGSHMHRFELYLSHLAGHILTLDDVIDPAALARIAAGQVKRLKVRIAGSRNPEAIDPNNWESGIFDLMDGVDGTAITLEVATRRRGNGLSDAVKDVAHRLMDADQTRGLQVTMLGEQEPIDLFADCVKDRISVGMVGLYPITEEIFTAMSRAKDRQKATLDAYFGQGNNVLE